MLILVRHAAVQINPQQPARTWNLSPDGRSRCRAFAPRLRPYQPSIFITSDEPKAQETGQILAAELGVPWHPAPNLCEHDRTGAPFLSSKAEFTAQIADFFTRPDALVFGRETAVQAGNRFDTAVHAVMAPHSEENIAIVAHGTVITLFLTRHNPHIEPLSFWQALTQPAACIFSWPQKQLEEQLLFTVERPS